MFIFLHPYSSWEQETLKIVEPRCSGINGYFYLLVTLLFPSQEEKENASSLLLSGEKHEISWFSCESYMS